MKHLSFKILILYILLPPVLYILSAQSIEKHLKARYLSEIKDIYIGDTLQLFDGSVRLQDAVTKNIDLFLQNKALISYGVKTNITVATEQGTLVYPAPFEESTGPLPRFDPAQVAADNYNLMHEGLLVQVDLKLEYNTLLSNVIISFYIFASILALYFYYLAGLKKAKMDELEKSTEMDRLLNIEKEYNNNLIALEREKEKLTSKYSKIKKELENEKIKATSAEDEMIAEIITLEEKIEMNLSLQEEQRKEINASKQKIKRFEGGKQKTKGYDTTQKRFKALYKNITINERAISGFMELTDDLRIKSEEIIHKLNENPKLVPIKRKVFGEKNRKPVQEVIFAYKGRLYFHVAKEGRIEVLAVGTKNTQTKDMGFLAKV